MKKTIRISMQSLAIGAFLLSSSSLLAEQADGTVASTAAAEDCTYNNTTPIIPDGNIASQDELIAAQTRIKAYQQNLQVFRDCLANVLKGLDAEDETLADTIKGLHKRSDNTITLETKVADEFNQAIRLYKAR